MIRCTAHLVRTALWFPLAGAYLLYAVGNLHRLRQLTQAAHRNPEDGAALEAWVTAVIGEGL